MFSFTHDKFNFSYKESKINNDIDVIASLFDLHPSLPVCLESLCFNDYSSFVCWSDQRRIAKCIIVANTNAEYLLFVKPRLEFILSYDFIAFIESLRDYVFSVYPHDSKFLNIVFSDLSQGVEINNFLPAVDCVCWRSFHSLT